MICASKEFDRQRIAVICIFAILNVCWGMMASLPVSFKTTADAVFIMRWLHFKCNDNSFQGAPLSYTSVRERRLWVSNQPRWEKEGGTSSYTSKMHLNFMNKTIKDWRLWIINRYQSSWIQWNDFWAYNKFFIIIINCSKDTTASLQKTIKFPISKNQTKWPIELWTLKRDMETDEDHATMRESFSLVQNILFIKYTNIFPAHL